MTSIMFNNASSNAASSSKSEAKDKKESKLDQTKEQQKSKSNSLLDAINELESKAAENNNEYTIQKGDSLWGLAEGLKDKEGFEGKSTSQIINDLATSNSISNPDKIYAGDKLNLGNTQQIGESKEVQQQKADPNYQKAKELDKEIYELKAQLNESNGSVWGKVGNAFSSKDNKIEAKIEKLEKERAALNVDTVVKADESKLSKEEQKVIAEYDKKIADLEEKIEKTSSGVWSGVYNAFSKKDEKMEKELEDLKRARTEFSDGITKQELKEANTELTQADEGLDTYKAGKKKAADTASTIAAIGAGVVVGVATGGTGLVAIAAGAAASGGAKMLSKEAMLGDEYEMLGKEGLTDGAISAAYGAAGGVVGAAAKTIAPALGNGAARVGVKMTEATTQTVAKYGTKLVADEAFMVGIKKMNGQEVTMGDVFATGVASVSFTALGNQLSKTKLLGITQDTEAMVKTAKISTVAAGTYIGKKQMSKLINDAT